MPAALDIVDRLHRRLLEIIATALPLMTSSMRDADLEGLTFLREEMVEAIASYRRYAYQAHATAIAGGSDAAIAGTAALCFNCTLLDEAYGAFRERWAQRLAVEHWAEYRLTAIRMMKSVRNHVLEAREEQSLLHLDSAA